MLCSTSFTCTTICRFTRPAASTSREEYRWKKPGSTSTSSCPRNPRSFPVFVVPYAYSRCSSKHAGLIPRIFQQLQLKYFQTFRIIFSSIKQSLGSIFWFFCVVFIGLISLVMIRMTIVDNHDLEYSSFGAVLSKVMLGIFVRNPNNAISINRAMESDSFGLVVFEYMWYVLTNVLVIPFFVGLVYSNYSKNKQKYQLALAVIEEIDRMVSSATEGQASSLLQFKFYSQFERIKNSELFSLLEMKKKVETEQIRRFLLSFKEIIMILKRDYPNLKIPAKSSLAIRSPTVGNSPVQKSNKLSLSDELAKIEAQRKKDLEMKSRQENVKSLKDIFQNNLSEIFFSKSINKFISKDTMLLITQQLRLDVCDQKLKEISLALYPLSHNVLNQILQTILFAFFMFTFIEISEDFFDVFQEVKTRQGVTQFVENIQVPNPRRQED